MIRPRIEVEGMKELQSAIRKQQGKLPASIGEAHKEIGRFIIGKIPAGDPNAVGEGTGASVRPSATKREVMLLVGSGAAREKAATERNVPRAYPQWGRTEVQPFRSGRPHIVGVVEQYQDEIEQKFMDETVKALAPAFHDAE